MDKSRAFILLCDAINASLSNEVSIRTRSADKDGICRIKIRIKDTTESGTPVYKDWNVDLEVPD